MVITGMLDGGDDLQGATTLGALLDIDLEHSFTKALSGFRPSGRRSPFKTAPGGFVSSWATHTGGGKYQDFEVPLY